MDDERIASILKSIEKNLDDVDARFKDGKVPTESDKVLFDAGCMSLFQALNRSIDLADEVIASKRLGVPGSYSDSFNILKDARVISENICNEMKKLVIYRNLISHEYYNLSPEDVKKVMKKLSVVHDFLEDIKRAVR